MQSLLFVIDYDEAAVQIGRQYTVRATKTRKGHLALITDQAYPVFDGCNASLEMRLVAARAKMQPLPRSGSAAETAGLPRTKASRALRQPACLSTP